MRILFLSHYFPPEVNAPATRTFENCREWVRQGHEVHVVTGFPSHPAGRVFRSHSRAWYRCETMDGIQVHRVWTLLAANRGFVRRSLGYLSFLPASVWRAARLGRFDVVVATSPHLFNAAAGWLAGRLKSTPWVYELRDLWPDSIVAVGAVRSRRWVRVLGWLDRQLCRRAAAVVCVTRSFVEQLTGRGVAPERLAYIPAGIYPEEWSVEGSDGSNWRRKLDLGPQHILVTYAGTLGLAHGLDTVIEAAARLEVRRPEIRFVLAGDGAERHRLADLTRSRGLGNVFFTGLISRAQVRQLVAGSDVCLVLLRDQPLFRTVLPSKMFEAMAAGRPLVLGVAGEAKDVLEASGGGISIPPEDAGALCEAIESFADDPSLRRRMGACGRAYVTAHFDRRSWSTAYLGLLKRCAWRGADQGGISTG